MNRRLLCSLALAFVAASSSVVAAQEAPALQATPLEASDVQSVAKNTSGEVSVIVKFDVAPLATYRGGRAGLAPTSPAVTGARRLSPASASVRAYTAFLAQKERQFEAAVQQRVPSARVVHRFRNIIGGVSVVLPADRVKELRGLPGVKAVYPDVLLRLDTDRSPEFIGAPVLWDAVGGQANAGDGVIVGIVDSGIWPEHPSVADNGMPAPPAQWTGTECFFGENPGNGDAPFTCNNKLIGAARFMETFDNFGATGVGFGLPGEFKSARDNNGHGSHTATTATGDADVLASTGTTVSGIAPRAHLAVYKVCFTKADGTGSCYTSDSAAAVDQAVADGVDVINFSIGGGNDPYSDAVSLAFLDAYEAGVFVAASAGNDGPDPDTVEHREPWVATAAATTTDKSLVGHADLTAEGGATATVNGASATQGVGSAYLVLTSTVEDGAVDGGTSCPATADVEAQALCCNPFPAGSLAGKIAVCKRGLNARVQKSANVAAGGAAGMILYNTPAADSLVADLHSIPSLHINAANGVTLLAFMNDHAMEEAALVRDNTPGQGDVTAAFSSRGGAAQTLGISKPDLAAPGVDILAANTPDLAVPAYPGQADLWQIISGTSMASPHVAGSGALLRQLHPDWTPGQIKSALMMTATMESVAKEDRVTFATPFDVGSGRIDLTRAGNPGLTISETADNYVLLAGNLATSNYPSLYLPVLAGKATVQRTLKSVDTVTRTWKLSVEAPAGVTIDVPATVTLARGREKPITISVDASTIPVGETRHAVLRFKSGGGAKQVSLAFPVTIVRKQGSVTLDKTCTPLPVTRGGAITCTINFTNTTFSNQDVTVTDVVPAKLAITGVTGATRQGKTVRFSGSLGAATPPQVTVAPGDSPAGGYLPLSAFGIPKQAGFGDETIANFDVPSFMYAGTAYTRIGVTSNGYVIVGGGTAAEVDYINQSLPNSTIPNNVLAPFWTDLNVVAASGVRVGSLTDGVNTWIVADWNLVPNFSATAPGYAGPAQNNTFQVWIGIGTVQDITYAYGATTSGEAGALTVGAENFLGNSGQNAYFSDGATSTGTLPTPATQLAVGGAGGAPGETKTITINAKATNLGEWTNCATMVTDAVFGEAKSCVEGETIKP
jgi:subtilisin family serine protease